MGVYYLMLGYFPKSELNERYSQLNGWLDEDASQNVNYEKIENESELGRVDVIDKTSSLSMSFTLKLIPAKIGSEFQFFTIHTPALDYSYINTSIVLLNTLKQIINIIRPEALFSVADEDIGNVVDADDPKTLFSYGSNVFYISDTVISGLINFNKLKSEDRLYRLQMLDTGWLISGPHGVGNEYCAYYTNAHGDSLVDDDLDSVIYAINKVHQSQANEIFEIFVQSNTFDQGKR